MEQPITNEELARMIAKGFENTTDDIKKLDQRMGGFDQRMDGFEQRMGGFEQRMGGFEQRMGGFEQRMGGFEQRMDHLDARMGRMEADLNEIRSNIVYRHEFEDLMARVKYLETKLGIESGK